MLTLEKKIQLQREARELAKTVAPGVPFVFIVDQMHMRVHTFEGKPCLKEKNRSSYTLTPYDYLQHPQCNELRRMIKAGWSGFRGAR